MKIAIAPFLLAAFLPLAACSEEKPPEKPRPVFEVVREIRTEVQKAADARQLDAEGKGERIIWRPRVDTCLGDLDRIVEGLEKRGEFGPPQDEQADELMRAGHDLGQATECDPKLASEVRPQIRALVTASKRLRRFSVPE